jgi:hypothetical protein
MAKKKPLGGKAFDSLLRKLVQVPKKEADRQASKDARRKAKRKK